MLQYHGMISSDQFNTTQFIEVSFRPRLQTAIQCTVMLVVRMHVTKHDGGVQSLLVTRFLCLPCRCRCHSRLLHYSYYTQNNNTLLLLLLLQYYYRLVDNDDDEKRRRGTVLLPLDRRLPINFSMSSCHNLILVVVAWYVLAV